MKPILHFLVFVLGACIILGLQGCAAPKTQGCVCGDTAKVIDDWYVGMAEGELSTSRPASGTLYKVCKYQYPDGSVLEVNVGRRPDCPHSPTFKQRQMGY